MTKRRDSNEPKQTLYHCFQCLLIWTSCVLCHTPLLFYCYYYNLVFLVNITNVTRRGVTFSYLCRCLVITSCWTSTAGINAKTSYFKLTFIAMDFDLIHGTGKKLKLRRIRGLVSSFGPKNLLKKWKVGIGWNGQKMVL